MIVKNKTRWLTIPKGCHGEPMLIHGNMSEPKFPIASISPWLGIYPDEKDRGHHWLDCCEEGQRILVKLGQGARQRNIWCVTYQGLMHILEHYIGILPETEEVKVEAYICVLRDTFGYAETKDVEVGVDIEPASNLPQESFNITQLLNNPDFLIAAFTKLKEEQEKNKQLTAQIEELQPKAEYYDKVLDCKDAITTDTIAKEFGKSAKWLNSTLHRLKVQYRRGRNWVLYSDYADCGYTCTKTFTHQDEFGNEHSQIHTYWTQAGRHFIHNLLRKEGFENGSTDLCCL